MSCNGCRVLRKGCSENCSLRPCLQWIDSPEAQGNATVFVAKFFGRAGLMDFISAVPESERTALFQSLLYEASGRTVNPVYGAIGLLWTGNWHVCQEAVETVLKGGTIRPLSSSFIPIGSNPLRNLSTKPQLATNSRVKAPAVQQWPSVPGISESAPSFLRSSVQSSQPKRTLDEVYKREVEQDLFRPSECKQQRSGNSGDIPRTKMEYGSIVPQWNTTRTPTFLGTSNPPFPHLAGCIAGASPPAEANSARRDTAIHRVAPMHVLRARSLFDNHANDISCANRARRDLSFMHEDLSSERCENLELDLTLSSAHLQSAQSGGTTKNRAESTRVSSPSTISFNSEGSVTDLESSDFPMSSCSGHLLESSRPWRESEHKLLDLLV